MGWSTQHLSLDGIKLSQREKIIFVHDITGLLDKALN